MGGRHGACSLGDGIASPALSASATMARATAAASGAVPVGTLTMQVISSAVCALRMLAFLADAAWLAVTANAEQAAYSPHTPDTAEPTGTELGDRCTQ